MVGACIAKRHVLNEGTPLSGVDAVVYRRPLYYDPTPGRFTTLDPFEGDLQSPKSLHKYLYCHAEPVNFTDPSGKMDFSLSSIMLGTTIVAGIAGITVGAVTNSAGSWWEGFIPGWGSGRGLGNAIRNGDPVGIVVNGLFLGLDLFTFGGSKFLLGSARAAPKLAEGVAKEELESLYKALVKVANDPKFVQRIAKAGFGPDMVPQLLKRLEGYYLKGIEEGSEEGLKIAQRFVSWTDGDLMALTRSAGKNWNKMAHELTHVLEYVANPNLLEKEALTWWNIMGAEYRAYLVQTGSKMIGGGGGFLTLIANTFDIAGVTLPLRELIYWEVSSYGWTG